MIELNIITFVNPHRLSNTYLIYSSLDKKAVIIDLGNLDQDVLLEKINQEKLHLQAVLLTHEHADHCFGVDKLAETLDFELICTQECAKGIADSKLNFSKYLDDIDEFEVKLPPTIVGEDTIKISSNLVIKSLPTPGHSPGSCCYFIGENCFSGDTFMATKTPLSFPNSNKEEYKKSLEKIHLQPHRLVFVYPGHGKRFKKEDSCLHFS